MELTSTFLLYRGLVHHHNRFLHFVIVLFIIVVVAFNIVLIFCMLFL